jgi:hypothetical protein
MVLAMGMKVIICFTAGGSIGGSGGVCFVFLIRVIAGSSGGGRGGEIN